MQIRAKNAVTSTGFKYVVRVTQVVSFIFVKSDLKDYQQTVAIRWLHQDFFPKLGITPLMKENNHNFIVCIRLLNFLFYSFCLTQRPQFHVVSL